VKQQAIAGRHRRSTRHADRSGQLSSKPFE
jgi:hypothetical protein